MQITLNGEPAQVSDKLTLAALLVEKKVENPEMVSVQINGDFIEKDQYGSLEVQAGAAVDFLYFMGGGQ